MTHFQESDLEPLPTAIDWTRKVGVILAYIAAVALLAAAVYLPLRFGWHPLPLTAAGCALHKRVHSGPLVVTVDKLPLDNDCLNVMIDGRQQPVRDQRTIRAVRGWLDARSNGWLDTWQRGSTLFYESHQGPVFIAIRSCSTHSSGSPDLIVSVDGDWLGTNAGGPYTRLLRPVCRDEWRELAALVSTADGGR